MLRPRRITKPAFPIPGAKVCDECERPKKIKRNHAGKSYCDACYKRGFTHMPCAGCGETCVAKRGTVIPYCRSCEAKQRLCKGCGEPVPHAGMIHEGEVVCPSCVPKYKPKEPCPNCGEPSSRLSRVGGEGTAICDHCRNEQDHVTCGTCGRYRKQAEQTAGKPICIECVEGITHTCPDCQKDVAGGGASRCRECAARARGRAQVEASCESIRQPWVQDLFRTHCEADLLTSPRGDVVRRIEKAAAFFATMDSTMSSAAAVNSDSLLEAYGPDGLRRASKAVLFIISALGIAWPRDVTEDFAENSRIQSMLEAIIDRPWAGDIAAYVAALQSGDRDRPLQTKTVRLYLRAAISLMERSRRDVVSHLDDEDLRRFEVRHRGHRASLSAFYAWAGLTLPVRRRGKDATPEKTFEVRILTKSESLLKALGASTSRAEAKALIANLIAVLYAKPLKSVLGLRGSDISDGEIIKINFDGDEFDLNPQLAFALRKWGISTTYSFVFSSDRRMGPISVSAVAYHCRRATSGKNKK